MKKITKTILGIMTIILIISICVIGIVTKDSTVFKICFISIALIRVIVDIIRIKKEELKS